MPSIAVIGGGPAGLGFAAAMARSNFDLTVLERRSGTSAKGSGFVLQPAGLAAAQWLGIRADLEALGQRIDRVIGRTTKHLRLVVDVDYAALGGGERYAVGLHRSALIDALLNIVEATAIPVVTDCDIQRHELGACGRVWLADAGGKRHGPFDLVVDASGALSTVRTEVFGKRAGTPLKYGSLWANLDLPSNLFSGNTLQQRMDQGNVAMGVMPIGRARRGEPPRAAFFWNVACSADAQWRAKGLAAWKHHVVSQWPECACLMEQIHSFDQLALARFRHHTVAKPWRPGFALIGDAAHAASPQLGQGVNMALLDAVTLAHAVRVETSLTAACRQYAARRRLHVGIIQSMARVLQPMYQSDNAAAIAMRNVFFQPMSVLPHMRWFIAMLVSGLIVDPLGFRA